MWGCGLLAEADTNIVKGVGSPFQKTALYGEKVRLLYDNLPLGLPVTAINAAVLAYMEWQDVAPVRIVAWLTAMLLVTLSRYALTHHYHTAFARHGILFWGRAYAVLTGIAGLLWGASAVWLFPAGLLPQIFLFFLLAAMTTAAVVSFAAIFSVALLFVIPVLAPLAIRFFVLDSNVHRAMGLVAVLFLAVMLLTAKRIEKVTSASLQSRFDNQDLIADLEAEKAAIQDLNAKLREEVAARTQAVLQLKEREGYLRAILENVEEGIVTIDQSGALRSVNREALRIFGYREEELLGAHFSQLVPLSEREEYGRFLEGGIEGPGKRMSGLGLEVNGLRRDGTIFPMELGLSTMSAGLERGFIAITRDLTLRRRSERLKSELIATLSHELKTPLAAASGSLGLLAETISPRLAGDEERLLAIARSNLERLGRALSEMLDVDDARIAGMRWAPVPVMLTGLVEEAVAAEAEYACGRHVRLALDPCSSPVVVEGDKDLLLRALSYVITNAVHLSPVHGTVELAVTCEGMAAVVSVRDCGEALPHEARRCLFDASADLAPLGIIAPYGLRTARAIVERHGGTLRYEARDAGGSRFFFQFPLARSRAKPSV